MWGKNGYYYYNRSQTKEIERKDLWLGDLYKSLNEFLGGSWQTSDSGDGHEESEQLAMIKSQRRAGVGCEIVRLQV